MKYILSLCLLAIASQVFAFGGRHCNTCYAPVYYHQPIHNTTTVVVEKQIIAPERIIRYREVPGLRIVEGTHGEQLILVGNRILNLAEGKTTSVVEEFNKQSVFSERIITRTDVYGNKTVTIEKEITK